jgi:Na+/proline symporter
VLIVAAGLVAPVIQKFETIYTAMQTMFSLFQGPTLALLVLGIFNKRTNSYGALFGLVTGVILSSCLNLIGDQLFPSDDPFLFIAFWTFVYSLIVTTIVSYLTPPPHPETQKLLKNRMNEIG